MRYSQGADGRPPRVGLAAAPRAQERLLHQVLRVVERSEQAVAVHVQFAAVRLDAGAEAALVECRQVVGVAAHVGYDGGLIQNSSPPSCGQHRTWAEGVCVHDPHSWTMVTRRIRIQGGMGN